MDALLRAKVPRNADIGEAGCQQQEKRKAGAPIYRRILTFYPRTG
jgi:hypothetical protein